MGTGGGDYGFAVAVRVGVTVNVLEGVEVGKRVRVGTGVELGTRVLVIVGVTGVRVGV